MTTEILELNKLTELAQYSLEDGFVLVEFPVIEDKTKKGIIKGEKLKQEEAEKLRNELKFYVAKVGNNVTKTKVGQRVILNAAIIQNRFYTPLMLDGKEYGQFLENDIIGRF